MVVWQEVEEIQDEGGKLLFDGCLVEELAATFGTPCYLYSEQRIRANYRRLKAAYDRYYANFSIYYAVKANSNPALVRILAQEGAGADCSSPAEIAIALSAGIPKEKILYSGVYNSDNDLAAAFESGVPINLEDSSQIDRLFAIGVPEFLSFRINPGLGSSGEEGLVFAGPDAKFGIPVEEIVDVYAKAKKRGVKRFGIHMMTGSNILVPDYFEEVVNLLLDGMEKVIEKLGIAFEFIDIGGSLGIPYRPEESPLDIDQVARRVSTTLSERSHLFPKGLPKLIQEPGRYLLGDAGMLLTQVTGIKRTEKRFVGVDAGMNTLLRPALYDSYHHLLCPSDLRATALAPSHIVGQVCENTDQFASDYPLPETIQEGDLLVLLDAGAYGFSMSSNYNSKPRAAEVLLNEGEAYLIREREENEVITRGTSFPSYLNNPFLLQETTHG